MGTLGGDPEDSFALMLALNSPNVEVAGITVVQGNVPAEKGYSNAYHLLELLGRQDVPLRRGCLRPLNASRHIQVKWLEQRYKAPQITPELEPKGDNADAVGFLIETVMAQPNLITLVTIGPLTNIASAMQREPAFSKSVKEIVMMGGTAQCAGNISPAAEFNFWQDPEAADIVFRSGANLTMVGLDVCHQTQLLPEQVARSGDGALGQFVKEATAPWFKVMAAGNDSEALHLYDSLAVAATLDKSLLTLEESHVEIDTSEGPAQGMSVSYHKAFQRVVFSRPTINAKVALDVDVSRFAATFKARVLDALENDN